jgi:hypothetical protein
MTFPNNKAFWSKIILLAKLQNIQQNVIILKRKKEKIVNQFTIRI